MQGALGSNVLLGGSFLSFNLLNSATVGTVYQYEPRLWLGLAF
jgi:hypothetical protein